jgi:hypothetical protein
MKFNYAEGKESMKKAEKFHKNWIRTHCLLYWRRWYRQVCLPRLRKIKQIEQLRKVHTYQQTFKALRANIHNFYVKLNRVEKINKEKSRKLVEKLFYYWRDKLPVFNRLNSESKKKYELIHSR